MATQSLFQKLQAEAYRKGIQARSEEARAWFKKKASSMRGVSRRDLLADPMVTEKMRPTSGKMYMYFYDPKYRETLPYYDAFPLIIMVERAKGGFYGLNLHYLSPAVRAKFLDKLIETANNRRFDETTKLKINYELLKSVKNYREFKPCFKHYLTKHVEGRPVQIDASEWEIAIFLPTEQFQKKTKQQVWKESREKFRK